MPYEFSLTNTLEILKAIGPLIVGGAVFYVAWRQWETAKDKLAIDLFDRRLKVWQEVGKGFLEGLDSARTNYVSRDNPVHHRETVNVSELTSARMKARWFFGPEVTDGLEEVSDYIVEIGTVAFDAFDESDRQDREERFDELADIAANKLYVVMMKLDRYMMTDHVAVNRPAKRFRLPWAKS